MIKTTNAPKAMVVFSINRIRLDTFLLKRELDPILHLKQPNASLISSYNSWGVTLLLP